MVLKIKGELAERVDLIELESISSDIIAVKINSEVVAHFTNKGVVKFWKFQGSSILYEGNWKN